MRIRISAEESSNNQKLTTFGFDIPVKEKKKKGDTDEHKQDI